MTELATTLEMKEREQRIILEVATKLAYFLKNNSIIARNDAFEEFLKVEATVVEDEETRTRLQHLHDEYNGNRQQFKAFCEQAKPGDDLPETPEDVNKLIKMLYSLAINGRALVAAVEVATASAATVTYNGETVFAPDLQTKSKRNSLQAAIYEKAVREARSSISFVTA